MEENKDLQLDDQIELHRKGWRLQAILWMIIALFVIGAALGLFGGGILSKQTVGEKNSGLWLEYERFARKDAPTKVELHLKGVKATASQIVIPSSYLTHFQLEAITPSPNMVATIHDQLVYSFLAEGALTVVFHFKPIAIGKVEGRILLNDQAFQVNHFIYP